MDELFVLAGFVALGLALGGIFGWIAFFRSLTLTARIMDLERRVGELALRAKDERAAPLAAPLAPADPQPVIIEPLALVPAKSPDLSVSEPLRPPATELWPTVPRPVDQPSSSGPTTPARKPSLEERLGARWTVWVGGVALALGSLLLVRYSIEAGLFGPPARVIAGLALAAGLVATGEWMRGSNSAGRSDIPAVLTAAGTVAAFGSIYAAYELYGFIGPSIAFAALGLTALACMILAAVHAPWLAGLGLLGALAVPLLISGVAPQPWVVVIYVAIVIAAAYGLMRLRQWVWLGIAGVFGAALWGVALVLLLNEGSNVAASTFAAALTHDCLHILLAAAAFGWPLRQAYAAPTWLSSGLLALLAAPALLTLALHGDGHFGFNWVVWASAPVATLLITGLFLPRVAGAVPLAGLFSIAVLIIWPGIATVGDDWLSIYAMRARDPDWLIDLSVANGTAVAAASLAILFLRPGAASSGTFMAAGTATLTPLVMLILVWLRVDHSVNANTFATVAGVIALAFVALASFSAGLSGKTAGFALGCFAAASIAALSLGFVFLLDRGMLTVALAASAAGTALVAARLDIPALRWCVAALGIAIAVRLAIDPRIVGAELGSALVFNWLLWGYGVPSISFAFAAFCLRDTSGRGLEDLPLRLAQSLALVFAVLLVFFEIRHAINGGNIYARGSSLVEQGLLTVSSMAFAILSTRLDLARAGSVFRIASLIFGLVSFGQALIGLCLLENPYFTDEPVEGGRVFNALLLGYAVPGVLALLLARMSRGVRPEWYRLGAALVALVLLFANVSLAVRRWFFDAQIGYERGFQQSEFYTYSLIWLLTGIVLLAYGILRGVYEARVVSGLFVLAAVFKIFIFDLAGLDGILRALSFIGLGFVLIGIGLVYQKLVFNRPPPVLEPVETARP